MKFGTALTICHVLVIMATSQVIEDFVPKKVQKMFSVLSQGKLVVSPPRAASARTPVGPSVVLQEDLAACRADVESLKNKLKNLKTLGSGFTDAEQMSAMAEGHCLEPVAPENGHVDFSSTMVGATANVTCDDNYTYLGQGSKFTCTVSGAWRSYTDEKGKCYQSTWTNPTDNFMEGLPYNLMAGTRITVLGRCTVADTFTVALVELGTDRKVFAMEVDMSTRTVRRYQEVADMAPDDTWSTFPFTVGLSFNITLSVCVRNIQILVDNQQMNLSPYSTQNLSLASHMTIQGAIIMERVELIYP